MLGPTHHRVLAHHREVHLVTEEVADVVETVLDHRRMLERHAPQGFPKNPSLFWKLDLLD